MPKTLIQICTQFSYQNNKDVNKDVVDIDTLLRKQQ